MKEKRSSKHSPVILGWAVLPVCVCGQGRLLCDWLTLSLRLVSVTTSHFSALLREGEECQFLLAQPWPRRWHPCLVLTVGRTLTTAAGQVGERLSLCFHWRVFSVVVISVERLIRLKGEDRILSASWRCAKETCPVSPLELLIHFKWSRLLMEALSPSSDLWHF